MSEEKAEEALQSTDVSSHSDTFQPYVSSAPQSNDLNVGWEQEEAEIKIFQDTQQNADDEGAREGVLDQEALEVEDLEPNYHDKPEDMTYGRRIARHLASKYEWYNPHLRSRRKNDAPSSSHDASSAPAIKPPSLDAAWAYFEHITLTRHFLPGNSPGDTKQNTGSSKSFAIRRNKRDILQRAEMGELEETTRLYSVWKTPESQLADFGIGVGLYFHTLKVLAIITFIAGLINIPNIVFFNSDDYDEQSEDDVKPILRGSAICTDQVWSFCPTCQRDDWERFPDTDDRYAETQDGSARFIRVNKCDVDFDAGLVSWISLLFIFIAMCILGVRSGRKEVSYDEAQQTSPDYSVEVENPPKDAMDPEEWREFFEQFENSHVTCCTVTLDNEDLIRMLVKRRQLLLKLELLLPPGVAFDKFNLDKAVEDAMPVPRWKKLLFIASNAETIRDKIAKMDEQIMDMSNKQYEVSNVFITFETEQAQRQALKALSVSRWDSLKNNTNVLPEHLRFRRKHVLAVREPPEPSSVRWEDLDETMQTRLLQRIVTFVVSLALLVGGGVLIALARRRSPTGAALTITALNTVTPMVCRYITHHESHSSEGSKQASLYIKVTAFRWINTAIITTIITPFTDTVTDGNNFLINSIYNIFITEMLKTPIMQLLDIMGNLNRHYFGPRAPDQRRMNLRFQGGFYELAERYTDMTKVLFLTFFYSAIFPVGFFFCTLTLFVHYWVDKFCLLRSWAPAPIIGTEIAVFSRNYFFSLTLLCLAVMSSYSWASFPYDNACETSNTVPSSASGFYDAFDLDGNLVNIYIPEGAKEYIFCRQDLIRHSPPAFPPLPSDQPEGENWMTDGQEDVTRMYGWTMIGVLVAVCIIFFDRIVICNIRKIFFSSYKPCGEATNQTFSEVDEIFGYIPQVKKAGFNFPLLVCDTSSIDPGLIGWRDPYHSFDFHNVIFDVKGLVKERSETKAEQSEFPLSSTIKASNESSVGEREVVKSAEFSKDEYEEKPIFSIVKHWPPRDAPSKLLRKKTSRFKVA